MLELYSKNVTVNTSDNIPFNNVALIKGDSAVSQGTATIQLNRRGVYKVSVSASVTASAAGVVSIQLGKNGILKESAVSSATAADATSQIALSFDTLVVVPNNYNDNCCSSIPTFINVTNTGVEATFNTINIVVDKIC